jgi:hypothetical protein
LDLLDIISLSNTIVIPQKLVVVVGNKVDTDHRQVTHETASQFARNYGLSLLEVAATSKELNVVQINILISLQRPRVGVQSLRVRVTPITKYGYF